MKKWETEREQEGGKRKSTSARARNDRNAHGVSSEETSAAHAFVKLKRGLAGAGWGSFSSNAPPVLVSDKGGRLPANPPNVPHRLLLGTAGFPTEPIIEEGVHNQMGFCPLQDEWSIYLIS